MAGTSRDQDKGCNYLSGNKKQALAKVKVAETQKHRGTFKNFLDTPSLKRSWISEISLY